MKLYIIDAIKRIYLNNEAASFEELYTYIDTDNDTIKESIAFILGEVGKKEFVTPLQKLLKTRNLDVRKNTIIALGKIGEITPLEELTKILEDDDSYWLLKKVAIDAIYKIFQVNWYKIKEKDEELETLFTRYSALLMDHLSQKDEENFKVKLSLIKFLEVYGGEKALDALLKRVNDFHRVVRIHASNAIKKIEEKLEMENTS